MTPEEKDIEEAKKRALANLIPTSATPPTQFKDIFNEALKRKKKAEEDQLKGLFPSQ